MESVAIRPFWAISAFGDNGCPKAVFQPPLNNKRRKKKKEKVKGQEEDTISPCAAASSDKTQEADWQPPLFPNQLCRTFSESEWWFWWGHCVDVVPHSYVGWNTQAICQHILHGITRMYQSCDSVSVLILSSLLMWKQTEPKTLSKGLHKNVIYATVYVPCLLLSAVPSKRKQLLLSMPPICRISFLNIRCLLVVSSFKSKLFTMPFNKLHT